MEISPLIGNAYTRNSNMWSKFTPDLYGSRDIGCFGMIDMSFLDY